MSKETKATHEPAKAAHAPAHAKTAATRDKTSPAPVTPEKRAEGEAKVKELQADYQAAQKDLAEATSNREKLRQELSDLNRKINDAKIQYGLH